MTEREQNRERTFLLVTTDRVSARVVSMMNVSESMQGALYEDQRKWLIRCGQKARELERRCPIVFRDHDTLRTIVGI